MSKMKAISLPYLRAKQLREIAKRRGVTLTELLTRFVNSEFDKLKITAFENNYLIEAGPGEGVGVVVDLRLQTYRLSLSSDDTQRLQDAVEEVAVRKSTCIGRNVRLSYSGGVIEVARRRGGVVLTVESVPCVRGTRKRTQVTFSVPEAFIFVDDLFCTRQMMTVTKMCPRRLAKVRRLIEALVVPWISTANPANTL